MDACSGYDAAQVPSFKWPGGDLQHLDELQTMFTSCKFCCGLKRDKLIPFAAQLIPFAAQRYHGGNYPVRTSDMVNTSYVCATFNQDENNKWSNFSYVPLPSNWTYYDSDLCPTRSSMYRTNPHSEYLAVYNWTNQVVNSSWWEKWKEDPKTSQVEYWAEWGFWPSNKTNFVCDTKNNVYQVSQSQYPSMRTGIR